MGVNKYKNKFEIVTGEHLTKKKVKFEYETEKLEYTITANYIPDFIIKTKSGKKIYIETKGKQRQNESEGNAMQKKFQLWVQWHNQSADNPQGAQDWTLVKEGNIESQYDLAEVYIALREHQNKGDKAMLTRDLDIDLVVAGVE